MPPVPVLLQSREVVMKRFAFASSVIVLLAFTAVSAFAQAKPAQAPAAKPAGTK